MLGNATGVQILDLRVLLSLLIDLEEVVVDPAVPLMKRYIFPFAPLVHLFGRGAEDQVAVELVVLHFEAENGQAEVFLLRVSPLLLRSLSSDFLGFFLGRTLTRVQVVL